MVLDQPLFPVFPPLKSVEIAEELSHAPFRRWLTLALLMSFFFCSVVTFFFSLMQLFPSRVLFHPITLGLISSKWGWRCLWPAVSWDSRGRGSGGALDWPIESPGQVQALVPATPVILGRFKCTFMQSMHEGSWRKKDESYCS